MRLETAKTILHSITTAKFCSRLFSPTSSSSSSSSWPLLLVSYKKKSKPTKGEEKKFYRLLK
jgi:hypothetical protein